MSLNCLFDVVLKSAILMGCVVPFIVELIYDNLRKCIIFSEYFSIYN